jgi:acetolactate synthase regulatory subunit
MLLIRPILERNGFRVSWDKAQQKATAKIAKLTATVEADNSVLLLGGQRVGMGRPAKLVSGRLQ